MDAVGILRFRVIQRERRRREQLLQQRAYSVHTRQLRDASDPYNMPENNFRGRYRLSRELSRALTEELRPLLRDGVRNTSIPVELKILSTLHILGQGNYQKSAGADNVAPMSQASISRVFDEVITAMNNVHFLRNNIVFPTTPAEIRRLIQKNYQRYPYLPGFLGLLDGTHVGIIAPVDREELYLNRKGYHSLNVQVCCDVEYKILNVVARYPGATHDSFVWNNSALRRTMENLYRTGERCWLLGDSGYPHEPWLQTPILNAAEGSREANYTRAHMITRSSVERAIGHLKERFRCLNRHRVLHYSPEKAGKIINACVVLHNKCVEAHEPYPDSDDEDEENWDDPPADNVAGPAAAGRVLNEARAVRMDIVARTALVPPAVHQHDRRHRRAP
ncbi:Putative nuclease [Frankliniella fusca]|uniref:Putative nuclease HARBI1 n=1 Tax=Frankliniella fusca TaxID=407009 RepID=A0AAE1LHF7_9NEOP|nr:Putative nuclease [Frankliniella fusca]